VSVDPVIAMTARLALALLFGSTAIHKLADFDGFRRAMYAYELVSDGLLLPAAAALILAEGFVALGLLWHGSAAAAGLVAAALLAVYTLAITVNLARGRRDVDCGCAGSSARQPLGPGLVTRNLVLMGASCIVWLPESNRRLVWLDWISVAAAVACTALVWQSANRLLSEHDRIEA
jgi:hypothetical protein